MDKSGGNRKTSTLQLIFVPALISLVVTLTRLAGEIRHWSPTWFSSETGGTLPSSPYAWVIGITWLAIPFGAYFGIKLAASAGKAPPVLWSLAWAISGVVVMYGSRFLFRFIPLRFPEILIPVWLFMACAAALQYLAWPALFKTLLAYGLAARIPVVVVYFLAMWANWGTHYDYVGMPPQFSMPLLQRFLWLGFFPQLIFWVGFTITAGSVAGVAAAAVVPTRASASATAPQ